jgi:hypothetical protein
LRASVLLLLPAVGLICNAAHAQGSTTTPTMVARTVAASPRHLLRLSAGVHGPSKSWITKIALIWLLALVFVEHIKASATWREVAVVAACQAHAMKLWWRSKEWFITCQKLPWPAPGLMQSMKATASPKFSQAVLWTRSLQPQVLAGCARTMQLLFTVPASLCVCTHANGCGPLEGCLCCS